MMHSLAYRLRTGVNYFLRDGSLLLLLPYPLKILSLNAGWEPVIRTLSCKGWISFESLVSLSSVKKPIRVESFLDKLVRSGFLERRGFRELCRYPSVSIIVPVRNRPHDIHECLQALLELDYPQDKIEIIVVDDASDDTTPQIVSTMPVRLIRLKQCKQAPFCRNLAAQNAQGEIIAFIDSDCITHPSWLKELIPAFQDASIGAVGGMVDSYDDTRGLDCYEKVKSSLYLGKIMKRSSIRDNFLYVPSCNMLVRREVYVQLGGFNQDLIVGEDVDLCWRLQDAGFAIEYWPAGKVYHKHRNTILSFCRRRFDYGTSEPMLHRLHLTRKKILHFPAGGSLFWVLLAASFIFSYPPLLAASCIPILLDAFSNYRKIKRWAIPFSFQKLLLVALRSYGALCYHWCAFVSRYYLVWALPLLFLWPMASGVFLLMHLLTGCMEFRLKRPQLSLPVFIGYFTLEQLSYQTGVWWGCLRHCRFHTFNPRVDFTTSAKEGP